MIDYSTYMMTPSLDEEGTAKAYARAQMRELMTFDKFVKHIAEHNGVFSRGTVQGVILDMCECLVEMLLDGKKVQLGALGDFFVSLNTEGAASQEEFTAANIKGVSVVFTPGKDFEGLRDRAVFNPVASRVAQAATLKAEKAGEATVNLEAAKRKPSTPEETGV